MGYAFQTSLVACLAELDQTVAHSEQVRNA